MGMQIHLLGKPRIIDADGQAQAVRGHQAWAILARSLLSKGPLDRRNLAAELFPETVDPLGSLRWCLASIRRALNSADSLTGDPIETHLPEGTFVDVWNLEQADFVVDGVGDLLEGIEPRSSPEFSTWLLIERERTAGLIEERLRQQTIQAVSVGDHPRAIRLAELGARRTPFDESSHILLVKGLTLAGRHKAALDHIEATENVFMAELGVKPTAALRSAARRTISSPPGGVSREAVVKSLMESGLAALSAGAADAGIDCLRRAVADAQKLKDTHLSAKAMLELGIALVHAVRGYDDEGAILLRQSTELARQCGAATIAATGFRELGYVDALAGRRPAAAAHLAQAAELAEDGDNLAGIHAVMGFNLVDWGKVDAGLEHYNISLDHARSAQNRRREIWSLGLGGWGMLAADRLDEADDWLTNCLALVEDQRWIAFRPWPVAVLSESKLRQRRDAMALRPDLENAFALSCQLGDPCWEAAVARALALSYAAMDDLPHALEWIIEARKRCFRDTDKFAALLVTILADQVEISLKLGQAAEADIIARELVSMAARAHMDGHVARAAELVGRRSA